MGINKASLTKIKKHLPSPWQEGLAGEFELSKSMIEKVMNGRRKNDLVVKRAIELSSLKAEDKTKYLTKLV